MRVLMVNINNVSIGFLYDLQKKAKENIEVSKRLGNSTYYILNYRFLKIINYLIVKKGFNP